MLQNYFIRMTLITTSKMPSDFEKALHYITIPGVNTVVVVVLCEWFNFNYKCVSCEA